MVNNEKNLRWSAAWSDDAVQTGVATPSPAQPRRGRTVTSWTAVPEGSPLSPTKIAQPWLIA